MPPTKQNIPQIKEQDLLTPEAFEEIKQMYEERTGKKYVAPVFDPDWNATEVPIEENKIEEKSPKSPGLDDLDFGV